MATSVRHSRTYSVSLHPLELIEIEIAAADDAGYLGVRGEVDLVLEL